MSKEDVFPASFSRSSVSVDSFLKQWYHHSSIASAPVSSAGSRGTELNSQDYILCLWEGIRILHRTVIPLMRSCYSIFEYLLFQLPSELLCSTAIYATWRHVMARRPSITSTKMGKKMFWVLQLMLIRTSTMIVPWALLYVKSKATDSSSIQVF